MTVTTALSTVAGNVTTSTTSTSKVGASESGSSFGDTLKQLVDGVEGSSEQANTAVGGMLDKSVDVHDAMIALQRAEMSLQLAVQIRNKLVQAYQDVMRMPV
jgi:flagellar hook-basal body complex protein FliE